MQSSSSCPVHIKKTRLFIVQYSGLKENTYSILFYSILSSGVLVGLGSGCLWFNKKKQQKFWGNWYVVPFKTVPTRDIRNYLHEKVTEFREIPRNFTELYVTEFGGIPPEF